MDIKAQSVQTFGTAVAPADNLAISTIAAGVLPAGRYLIKVIVAYGGVTGTIDGYDVRAGATNLGQIPIAAVANVVNPIVAEYVRDLDGATALTVNAHGAGQALSVYSALIVATQIKT